MRISTRLTAILSLLTALTRSAVAGGVWRVRSIARLLAQAGQGLAAVPVFRLTA